MSFKSKLRSTKSFATIFSLISITVFSLILQSCEKEELDIPQDYGLCNVKQIPMSELPEGVNPLVVNSREEFENIIYQLNNLDVKTDNSTSNEIISKEYGELAVGVSFKKLEISNIPRLKSGTMETGIIDVQADNVGGLSVLIHLAYTNIGGAITVTSTESSSTWFLGWEQTAGVASFVNGNNNIQYSVRGDVIAYILFEASLFEVSRTNYSIDGNINLSL
ncbi:hypothetical protein [Mangrovibacterium marinum]|uniref:hypothetical protein n=1 Tax=Mangrovibacterium marinum TaxID=1639118 RepID=UPI002A18E438|nr:hypothetical protein [Mangrovibacterium marinum]